MHLEIQQRGGEEGKGATTWVADDVGTLPEDDGIEAGGLDCGRNRLIQRIGDSYLPRERVGKVY